MKFSNRKSKKCRNKRCNKIFYANRGYKRHGFCSAKCKKDVMSDHSVYMRLWKRGVIHGDEVAKYVIGISSKSGSEIFHGK